MTIGDEGVASICLGRPHLGNPCERCRHVTPNSHEKSSRADKTDTDLHAALENFRAKCGEVDPDTARYFFLEGAAYGVKCMRKIEEKILSEGQIK